MCVAHMHREAPPPVRACVYSGVCVCGVYLLQWVRDVSTCVCVSEVCVRPAVVGAKGVRCVSARIRDTCTDPQDQMSEL